MSSSNALILWNPDATTTVATIPENSRPDGGRWALVLNALLSPSPGRTLDHVYTSLGKVLETQANRTAHAFGLGPHVIACKIKSYFGNAEERMQRLELLRITIPPKLEKKCLKLMKYTLPTEAANTQCQAFKEIVDLVTMFPGLRVLLLHTKPLENETSLDAISALWDRSTGEPDKELIFWQTLAATCLADTTISAVLQESSVADWGICHKDGLGVIERLLIEHDCCASSEYLSALCIRYLSGVLDLPGFWLNMESVHAHVANRLCQQLVLVLKDIGVDIPVLGPIVESEVSFDYNGVDSLANILLEGMLGWFAQIDREDGSARPWFESFAKLLQLLRGPRAAELLPYSSSCATNAFENILSTIYQDSVVYVMVDGHNTIPEDQGPLHDDRSMDLECESLSTQSIHGDTTKRDCNQIAQSVDDVHSQYLDNDFGELPTEDYGSTARSQVSDHCDPDVMQMEGTNEDIPIEFGERSRLDSESRSNLVQDLNVGTTDMHIIAGDQKLLKSTPYLSREARQKQAEQWRTMLLRKQMEVGNDNPSTLDTMERLAWIQYELGDFRAALVLEKRRIFLGNEHPNTLHAMLALGSTYQRVGRFKEAENLLVSALEKQSKILGEDHPEVLLTTTSLAAMYNNMGQWHKAEDLDTTVLEKQRESLGESHIDTIRTMGNLASTYGHLGQSNKAKELAMSVIEKCKKLLGDDHPDTLWSMSTLGTIYQELGCFTEAEEIHCCVLEKRTKLLGEDHPDTLRTLGYLASTYTQVGKFNAAKDLQDGALKSQRKLLGENHPDSLQAMSNLASTYSEMGQFAIAERL
ncbi:hypothetical protein K438DRAFT_2027313, partial [Mycena galopus ATCC 62051]